MELPTPENTLKNHSPEQATRNKHPSKAVHVNKSSSPAMSTAEARKNKMTDIALVKEWVLRPGGKLIAVPFNDDIINLEAHESI